MKLINPKLIPIIFLFWTVEGFSQSKYPITEGLNPDLYNGSIYNYGKSKNIKGHLYIQDEDFKKGSLTINDTVHNNLLLNYDIYNQKILFKFNQNGKITIISVPKEKIKEFSIDSRRFIVLNKKDWEYSIYELIGEGNYQILLSWSKDVEVSNKSQSADYTFTKAKRTCYFYVGSEMSEIKNRKDFLAFFDEHKAQLIKEFMKQNKIRIKRDSQEKLNILINYCNNI